MCCLKRNCKVIDGKVVGVSEVGGAIDPTPVEPFNTDDLISRNEKVQREALKTYYER